MEQSGGNRNHFPEFTYPRRKSFNILSWIGIGQLAISEPKSVRLQLEQGWLFLLGLYANFGNKNNQTGTDGALGRDGA